MTVMVLTKDMGNFVTPSIVFYVSTEKQPPPVPEFPPAVALVGNFDAGLGQSDNVALITNSSLCTVEMLDPAWIGSLASRHHVLEF